MLGLRIDRLPYGTISYEEFAKNFSGINITSTSKIPKIIFRTAEFKINALPIQIKNILTRTTVNNPEYIQVYLDSSERIRFIKDEFPEYLNGYLSVIPGAYQADIVRLLLIYKYGGLYNDIVNQYLELINQYIHDDDELIITKDFIDSGKFSISNGFIGAYQNHPILKAMINLVMYNVNNKIYGSNYLDITGPNTLGRAFNRFFNKDDYSEIKEGIYVLKQESIKYKIKVFYYDAQFITFNNKNFIKFKFERYNNIMYLKKKLKHYTAHWKERSVYK